MYETETIALFKAASLDAICDALDVVTRKRQYMSHSIRRLSGPRIVGPAATLMAAPTAERAQHIAGMKLLDTAPEGSVIVAELGGETDAALWGAPEIAIAMKRRIAGFVGDGAIRSIQQAHGELFGIYATNVTPASAFGRMKTMFHNAPINCGGVEILPGDLIIADEGGILSIPKAAVAEVASLVERYELRLKRMIDTGRETGSIKQANALHWNVD
jgi:4-hydroxy-4-methyl-2-oxoglutarate aldolase